MPTMTAPPPIDFDQLCENMTEQQLKLFASISLRKLTEKFGAILPFVVCDEDQMPIACFAPMGGKRRKTTEEEDAEFIRIAEERMANPNRKLLSVEEFLAAITKKQIQSS